MRRVLARLSPVFHLTRVTTAFAAIGNIWFVILWTRAFERDAHEGALEADAPLWTLLLGGAVVGVSLYAFAAALNDTLDLRRDRILHPRRPLPSGRLNIDAAIGMVVLSLMAAVLGALTLGQPAVLMALLTAGAVFFYNTAARFVPAVGLVALSLIYAAHMLIPNYNLIFLWPVWLVMTHALLVAAATHRLSRRRPALSMSATVAATLGWAFWSLVLLYIGWQRADGLWPAFVNPAAAILPALLAASFLPFAWWKTRRAHSHQQAADKISRYGALWLTLYAVSWMLGQAHFAAAGILAGLAFAGFLGMTVLRELYALLEQPLTYRR